MKLSTIIIAVLIFGFLIVIHELGHFISAKLSKVRVEEFAIGMGPKIFGYQGKETLYTLRLIPMGGFCKMLGEDENNYTEGSFNSKGKLNRIIILAAGSIMNILGCIILLSTIFIIIGIPTTTITSLEENYPAYEAGIEQGDTIVAINDNEIKSWEDISQIIDSNEVGIYNLNVLRNNENLNFQVSSQLDEGLNQYRIGITPEREKNIFSAVYSGLEQTVLYTKLIFTSLIQLVSGGASTDDLMGPIGVVSMVGETVKYGITAILNLAAVISLNLAIFNLLPIPALDGSRIVFVIIEWIKGSPISQEKEGMVHFVGFAALLVLAVFIAYKDILRLG
ncbi:RIP metalloprotease RseP [Alkalibaculum sp. M08DMB]|uniref:Zinc metalloprotease n=1 Tax=Alkalibaculum sporogenes TaxID=2655001 RepID=A0A6A7K950_9FIRM|nr:RIP metalloprotease RseP [Alkalibaculum sporogenes]MPW25841.1 RIP metalloprotease RseP [Alkalibaculum sporogenes]